MSTRITFARQTYVDDHSSIRNNKAVDQNQFLQAIGKEIRIKRDLKKLTADQLAKRINLSRVSITNIENGRQNVSAFQLYKISQILGCQNIDELIPTKSPVKIPKAIQNSGWSKNLTLNHDQSKDN
jgi:DNA-binding XRE family transcriptional regulator